MRLNWTESMEIPHLKGRGPTNNFFAFPLWKWYWTSQWACWPCIRAKPHGSFWSVFDKHAQDNPHAHNTVLLDFIDPRGRKIRNEACKAGLGVCCFILLTRGWGRLETRPPVALGSSLVFSKPWWTCVFSGIQFTRYFIEFVVVETKQIVSCNSNVILTQTCGQRLGMAAESKRRAIAFYFSVRICCMFLMLKCRGELDLGLCMTSVLAKRMPLRGADFRRILRPNTFKNRKSALRSGILFESTKVMRRHTRLVDPTVLCIWHHEHIANSYGKIKSALRLTPARHCMHAWKGHHACMMIFQKYYRTGQPLRATETVRTNIWNPKLNLAVASSRSKAQCKDLEKLHQKHGQGDFLKILFPVIFFFRNMPFDW